MVAYEELDEQAKVFVDRYLASMNSYQSAIDAKYDRNNATKIGYELLMQPKIKEAIKERRKVLNDIVDTMEFEKEDLLRIYWDMFNDAKKKGKLADARSILSDIAKYNGVNPDEIKKEIAVLNFNLDGNKI